ncbi:hypothetical protein Sjap_003639 [Stephania japonica]|uniref:Xrn1 helical domain-containing protein n=1 Tax=Stephania japonica TaxID=461633 RepID=A0AAP0PVN6_9MAGN
MVYLFMGMWNFWIFILHYLIMICLLSGGMNGYMYISDKPACSAEVSSPIKDTKMITRNKVISVLYKCPPLHPQIPRPPEGVAMPQVLIHKKDVKPTRVLWSEKSAASAR